ncbi:MAG TPA: hypothetical protein VJ963_10045, partial [Bacteroidales bacterium]|nr:hypothetical protein [Bacteroidales bacterium]
MGAIIRTADYFIFGLTRLKNPILAVLVLFFSPLTLNGQCNDPANIPDVPFLGNIIPPSCTVSTGSISLSNLPATGEWTVTRYPGLAGTKGTGTSTIIDNIPAGIYYFTVTNDSGCTSSPSSSFTITAQPPTPSPPVITAVTVPEYPTVLGAARVENLPSSGNWVLFRLPDSIETTGSGTSWQVADIPAGEYSFVVKNYAGCISLPSGSFLIPLVDTPYVSVTDPVPVCYPATVDITDPDLRAGSSPGLVYSYWLDSMATRILLHPERVVQGRYYLKGTNEYGFFSVKAINA